MKKTGLVNAKKTSFIAMRLRFRYWRKTEKVLRRNLICGFTVREMMT